MMPTIARYSPSIAPRAWLRWLLASRPAVRTARDANLRMFAGGIAMDGLELESGRQALVVWLDAVRRMRGGGDVLIPAQICSVVPESIRRAGLNPRFIDGDGIYPTPSPRQYASAIDRDTVAILIAPLYGYLQPDWQPLLEAAGDRPIGVDLAQGLGLLDVIDRALVTRADALIYSFGLGKGIDSGGGLLLARDVPGSGIPRGSSGTQAGVFIRALAIRFAAAAGVYRFLVPQMEEASESAKESAGSFAPKTLSDAVHLLWRAKSEVFLSEMQRARKRAASLSHLRNATRELDAFIAPDAAPLRQIVRLKDARARHRVIEALRRAGVDCAPAGEPLPEDAATLYPHAFAFGEDAIRLPFLGRISDREFAFVRSTLESTLVDLPN